MESKGMDTHDNRTFYSLLVACLYINFNSPYSDNEYKEKRGEVGMCYGGYGYGGGYSGGGISSFALIVVLFILLVIVGASFYN
jgi:uncharacterized protein (TIGR01732 family)